MLAFVRTCSAADRLFAQAIARSFDLEDDRVVQKPIEQRSGDDGIAKIFHLPRGRGLR